MKKRVHELAKEYGMSSKDFLTLLKDEIKLETAESLKNLSGLSVDDVERVRKYFEEMTAPKESVEEKGVALNKKLLEKARKSLERYGEEGVRRFDNWCEQFL